MPRMARTVAQGYPHHVTQRKNYQQKVFNDEDDEEIIKNIRKCSTTGKPYGNDRFMKRLEKLFGRRLRALPWGKPRNK